MTVFVSSLPHYKHYSTWFNLKENELLHIKEKINKKNIEREKKYLKNTFE